MNTFTESQRKIDNPTPASGYVMMALIAAAFAALLLGAPSTSSVKAPEGNTPEMQKPSGQFMEKHEQQIRVAKT